MTARQMNVTLPADLLRALETYADREHVSRKWVVQVALEQLLEKEKALPKSTRK